MQRLVGIIRNADELAASLKEIDALKERAKNLTVEGRTGSTTRAGTLLSTS